MSWLHIFTKITANILLNHWAKIWSTLWDSYWWECLQVYVIECIRLLTVRNTFGFDIDKQMPSGLMGNAAQLDCSNCISLNYSFFFITELQRWKTLYTKEYIMAVEMPKILYNIFFLINYAHYFQLLHCKVALKYILRNNEEILSTICHNL